MRTPDNLEHGRSRIAHLRKVIARDASDDGLAAQTTHKNELYDLSLYMDHKYPGWDDPAPPPEFPPTLRACKRLAVRIHAQMTTEGVSKKTRALHREQLDLLEAHIRETFPE